MGLIKHLESRAFPGFPTPTPGPTPTGGGDHVSALPRTNFFAVGFLEPLKLYHTVLAVD